MKTRIYISLIFIICFCNVVKAHLFYFPYKSGKDLNIIEEKYNTIKEREEHALKLLKKYDLNDQGWIYFWIAKWWRGAKAYTNVKKEEELCYNKAIEYSKKALEYPLEVEDKCEVYSFLLQAMDEKNSELFRRHSKRKQFIVFRRESAKLNLEGLKLVYENIISDEEYKRLKPISERRGIAMQLKGIDPITKDPIWADIETETDPETYKLMKETEERWKAAIKCDLYKKFKKYEKDFIDGLSALYDVEPKDMKELSSFIDEIFKDEGMKKKIISKVQETIEDWKEEEEIRKELKDTTIEWSPWLVDEILKERKEKKKEKIKKQ